MADVAEEVTVRVGGAGVTERIGKEERRPVEDDQVVAASQVCFHRLRPGPPRRDGSSNSQTRDGRKLCGQASGFLCSTSICSRLECGGPAAPWTRGDGMPTVIAHHDVNDTEHWLASPKREEVFGPLGVTNIRTFVSPDDPKKVAVLMDIPDIDAVMSYMQTQGAADAMEFDGVLPETLVFLVEQRPA